MVSSSPYGTKPFDTKSFTVEGYVPQPTPEIIWPILAKLNLKPLTSWRGIEVQPRKENRGPMAETVSVMGYTDKVEKVVLSFAVFMKRMAGTFMTIFPNDDYDFPIFTAELIENPGNLHFLCDMHPLRDLVIDEWYREKYLDPVAPIWKEYQDVHNDINPLVWFRSFLSPYPISGRHKPQDGDRSGYARIVECLAKYVEYYVDNVVPKATPIESPEAKEFVNKKKEAIRTIYQTRDPGAAVGAKLSGRRPEAGAGAPPDARTGLITLF